MRQASISEILDPDLYNDGDIVGAVEATLSALYKENKGTGGRGAFSYQDGELEDDEGNKIKVTFSKCPQDRSAVGQVLFIESKKTNHGVQGIKVEDKEYPEGSGNWTRRLRITSSAEISYSGGGGGGGNQSGYGRQSGGSKSSGYGKPSNQQPAQNQTQQTAAKNKPMKHPTQVLDDMLALHMHCDMTVRKQYKLDPDNGYTQDCLQGYVSTMFIESCKQGLQHDFQERLKAPVQKVYPPWPEDSSKWREGIIPGGDYEGKKLEDLPKEKLLELWSHMNEKGSQTKMAKCVRHAVKELGLEPPDALNPDADSDDEIPF